MVSYQGYQAIYKETAWDCLIRQKINNLYTKYFDKEVILQRDYMYQLSTPKRLYFQWLSGTEFDADVLNAMIVDAMSQAEELKHTYQKQKMNLSWTAYESVIEGFLQKILNNCTLIEHYETASDFCQIYDFINEDNFYIRYICKSLEGEMRKWQKQYYGIRDHKKYKRCTVCGCLIEINKKKDFSTKYCKKCAYQVKLQQVRQYKKRNRNKS